MWAGPVSLDPMSSSRRQNTTHLHHSGNNWGTGQNIWWNLYTEGLIVNELANCLRWPHFLHPRSLLPTLCSKTLANSDLFPETVAFQLTSKHQRKDFTTPPHPFRLQSYSRAPCLNKRCSIFLGNDETTSHKRKVKIPQEQKGFLENKQNSFPARAKWKDLISRLFILGKGACCAGNGRD